MTRQTQIRLSSRHDVEGYQKDTDARIYLCQNPWILIRIYFIFQKGRLCIYERWKICCRLLRCTGKRNLRDNETPELIQCLSREIRSCSFWLYSKGWIALQTHAELGFVYSARLLSFLQTSNSDSGFFFSFWVFRFDYQEWRTASHGGRFYHLPFKFLVHDQERQVGYSEHVGRKLYVRTEMGDCSSSNPCLLVPFFCLLVMDWNY